MQTETVCQHCFGSGKAWPDAARIMWLFELGFEPGKERCLDCRGTGRVPERKEDDHGR